jgi:hypothetical protein
MAMDLTFTNLFQFISIISPFLLGFFLIMISVFNQDLKAFVYLGGLLLATIINVFLMNIVKSDVDTQKQQPICNIINMPFGMSAYNSPSMNSMYIAFTMSYLFLPMFTNNQVNYGLLSFMISLFLIDATNKIMNYCTNFGGILLGLLTGLTMGGIWYTIFHTAGYDSLLYFDETMSNKVYCAKPQKQTFKCSVYKNGELIKTL